jgi:hypothetical protein
MTECGHIGCPQTVISTETEGLCYFHSDVEAGLITDVVGWDGELRSLKPKKKAEPKLRYCAEPGCLEQDYARKCRRHR